MIVCSSSNFRNNTYSDYWTIWHHVHHSVYVCILWNVSMWWTAINERIISAHICAVPALQGYRSQYSGRVRIAAWQAISILILHFLPLILHLPPLLLFLIAVGCIELCRFPHILLSLRLGSDNCITVFVQTQCTHCCFLLCLSFSPTCRAGNCATIAAPAAIAPLKNLCSLVGDWKCTK